MKPIQKHCAPTAGLLAVLMLAMLAATGCQRVPPVRTLPSWVRGIYIPMVKNSSFEPGMEETATKLIQEEFLADGRLNIVRRDTADLIVSAEITDWNVRVRGSSGDHVADQETITVRADLKLYEPNNMQEPLADLGRILLISGLDTDTRDTRYEPEPDSKRRILTALAQRIVQKTIEGFPAKLQGLPAGVSLPDMPDVEDISSRDIFQDSSSDNN